MSAADRKRGHLGLEAFASYPLLEAIFKRRSRRVSKGIGAIRAGSLSWQSEDAPRPLAPLEQAVLMVVTGATGITMPDMPTQSETGAPLLGSPMLEAVGRAASSPDNAQATVFFMVDDTGTYLLRRPDEAPKGGLPDADTLVQAAESAKVRVLDHRLELPRRFPCYVGRNRYVSNLPGSTLFIPVVSITRQYINGLLYLLSQEDGQRPAFIDDWRFYRWAGCRRWIKNGFLNPKIRLPLGLLGTFRIQIEAELLIQNLLLAIQAMGLGGWVHAGFPGPLLLGDPDFRDRYGPGLGFDFVAPKGLRRLLLRPLTPLPAWKANPVGLGSLLTAYCPPHYPDMRAAVDAVVEEKYGPAGLYSNPGNFEPAFKPGLAQTFIAGTPKTPPEVIECTKDICSYIFETYGRFPAHVDAFYVPGIWVQAHHLAEDYYDQFYVDGYSRPQAEHNRLWHS